MRLVCRWESWWTDAQFDAEGDVAIDATKSGMESESLSDVVSKQVVAEGILCGSSLWRFQTFEN